MPQTQNRFDPLFDRQGAENPLDVLKQVYGYSTFRCKQAEVVERVVL